MSFHPYCLQLSPRLAFCQFVRPSRCSCLYERLRLHHYGQNIRKVKGSERVRLRYRHLMQFEDYETIEMTLDSATGKYAGIIPGSFIVPERDLMYFVEAVAKNGDGRMVPDLEREMPYVIVPVQR